MSERRGLPHSDQAEMALLGSMLIDNRAFDRVADRLKPEYFASHLHGMLFEAIAVLLGRGRVADPISISQFKGQNPDLVAAGGMEYLLKLASNFAPTSSAADYARIVHDFYLRRRLIALGETIVASAFSSEDETPLQLEKAEKRLFDLAARQDEGGFAPLKTPLDQALATAERAFQRDGGLSGVSVGLSDLDALLCGMQPSDLLILAARPSMGKTALALNIAANAAKTHGVAVFSLEMSAEQLALRLLAEEAGLAGDRIRTGSLTLDEFERLVLASRRLEQLELFIDDTPALSIAALRSRARRLHRQVGISLIAVDYLQLLSGAKSENRVQEISDITRGLKAVAKELNVPVLALSQLSRQVEARADKRPLLSDLRDSGSIEQDADVVMFLYREEYYLARREPDMGTDDHAQWATQMASLRNLAEIAVAKQRNGPIGRVMLHFDAATTKFSSLSRDGI